MRSLFAVNIILAVAVAAASGCSGNNRPSDPTGLTRGMTKARAIEIMGSPDTVKPAGKNKEILIYRKNSELIHVFLINGRIKNIDRVRRKPMSASHAVLPGK